jgi:acetyl esterase
VLAGRPVRIDGQELEPEVQLVLKLVARGGRPSLEELPVAEARAELLREARLVEGGKAAVAATEEIGIPGPDGLIRGRLYRPRGGTGPLPLLVYLHGGGWVVGDLDSHDGVCRFLAHEARILVLSVDYRRAPEHRFPAAAEDAFAAFEFAVDRAVELGARPDAIALGGDSAGGNLTAAVTLIARAAGGPQPAFALMLYPATDLSAKRESYRLFGDGFFLTERQMDWYRDHYLPSEEAARDPRASPLLADDLGGLPPAYVATAGFDPLRDEGEEYARRLRAAGVPVTLRRHAGLIHGFANATSIGRTSKAAMIEAVEALRGALTGSGEADSLTVGARAAGD